jgi:hypothetical protein
MNGQFNNTISEDKMLGREYILATYFLYMKRHDASRGVLQRRLHALLSAYNPDIREDWEDDFVFGNLIDEECSEEKLRMIEEIIGRKMYDDLTSPPTDIYFLRRDMFHALLQYRVKVEEIRMTFDGVMECSVGFEFGIQHSKRVNKEILTTIIAKVDRVLLLLLGDKYDKQLLVKF